MMRRGSISQGSPYGIDSDGQTSPMSTRRRLMMQGEAARTSRERRDSKSQQRKSLKAELDSHGLLEKLGMKADEEKEDQYGKTAAGLGWKNAVNFIKRRREKDREEALKAQRPIDPWAKKEAENQPKMLKTA